MSRLAPAACVAMPSGMSYHTHSWEGAGLAEPVMQAWCGGTMETAKETLCQSSSRKASRVQAGVELLPWLLTRCQWWRQAKQATAWLQTLLEVVLWTL